MVTFSRILAVAGPALVLVMSVIGLRDRWGHTLIRPGLWFSALIGAFFTVWRTAVLFGYRNNFDFTITMNNIAIFMLSLTIVVFLVGAWKWRQLGYPYQVTNIRKRGVRR